MSLAVVPTPRPLPRELDASVLGAARSGDAGAGRRLVEHHQQPVFAFLSRMLGPRGHAALVRDVAQETFLRVFRSLPRFDAGGPARLSTWILTIAARAALDALRRARGLDAPLEAADGLSDPAADRAHDRTLVRRTIARALARLTPDHRAIVLLRDAHDLDYDEIAEALEIDVGTVKSRLSRARAALRAALEEDERS